MAGAVSSRHDLVRARGCDVRSASRSRFQRTRRVHRSAVCDDDRMGGTSGQGIAARASGTDMVAASVAEGIQPTMSALDLTAALTDPLQVRQAFLLNEILRKG